MATHEILSTSTGGSPCNTEVHTSERQEELTESLSGEAAIVNETQVVTVQLQRNSIETSDDEDDTIAIGQPEPETKHDDEHTEHSEDDVEHDTATPENHAACEYLTNSMQLDCDIIEHTDKSKDADFLSNGLTGSVPNGRGTESGPPNDGNDATIQMPVGTLPICGDAPPDDPPAYSVVLYNRPDQPKRTGTYRHRDHFQLSVFGMVVAILTLNLPGLLCLIPALNFNDKANRYNADGDQERAKHYSRLSLGCNVLFWIYGALLLFIIAPVSIVLGLVYGLRDNMANATDSGNCTCGDGCCDCCEGGEGGDSGGCCECTCGGDDGECCGGDDGECCGGDGECCEGDSGGCCEDGSNSSSGSSSSTCTIL